MQFSQSLNSEYKPDIRQIAANGVLRQGQRYRYDANDNIDNIQDLVNSSKNISLSYDGLDRISTANGYWGSGSFSYDTLGNLRQKNLGSQQLSYSYLNNRVSTVTGGYNFSYDERGNAVNNGRRSFNFNRANQLASSGSVSYSYDGHGRRIKKTTSTSQYSVYSQNGQLLLTDGPSGITRYVYLGKELVARVGNPAANDDKPGYTGHIEDRDIGLTYMQQRYYDPVIGRFYSNDPVDTVGHLYGTNGTYGFNRYAYANNNPYKYVDPDGQAPNPVIIPETPTTTIKYGGIPLTIEGPYKSPVTVQDRLKNTAVNQVIGKATDGFVKLDFDKQSLVLNRINIALFLLQPAELADGTLYDTESISNMHSTNQTQKTDTNFCSANTKPESNNRFDGIKSYLVSGKLESKELEKQDER